MKLLGEPVPSDCGGAASTLDDLIAVATEMRAETGGNAAVLMLTPRGYAHVQLCEALGFGRADGSDPQPVVLIAPV